MLQALSYHYQAVNQVHIARIGNDLMTWTHGNLSTPERAAYDAAVMHLARTGFRNMQRAKELLESAGFEVLIV